MTSWCIVTDLFMHVAHVSLIRHADGEWFVMLEFLRRPQVVLSVSTLSFPFLFALMDSPARTISSRDEHANEGLPLPSADMRELRELREEVNRMKRLLVQMANQLSTEEARRQVADAQRDHQLRAFMIGVNTAIQAFLTHQEVDMQIREHLVPGSLVESELRSDTS